MKKILIIVAVVAVVIVAALFYLNNRNRTMSPPGSATLKVQDLNVTVTYGRPSVRGRLIFGTKEAKALLPYGEYWRLGANEATEITLSQDVMLNGQSVKAGTYRMYAVPGPETFDIALNSELGKWGYFTPDYSLDVLHTNVPVSKTESPVEQYTIRLEPLDNGMDMVIEWSDTKLVLPIIIP